MGTEHNFLSKKDLKKITYSFGAFKNPCFKNKTNGLLITQRIS